MPILHKRAAAALLAVGCLVLGCGADHGLGAAGLSSGATCPPDFDLTYESFGRSFMGAYCTRCHDSERSGAARHGAPGDHNFDSLEEIRENLDHIDQLAAAGGASVNEVMPPEGAMPSRAERELLGQWLSCGAP